jgi:hypothetical protein
VIPCAARVAAHGFFCAAMDTGARMTRWSIAMRVGGTLRLIAEMPLIRTHSAMAPN